MIKILKIKNFQSHSSTELSFVPGINTIVGKSDSGKSAVIRALNALLFRGPFYLKVGQTDGFIEIETDDHTISRNVKSKKIYCSECKINSDSIKCPKCEKILSVTMSSDEYQIDDKSYSKFGARIPEELAELIGIRTINFGDYEENLNLRGQHQDMFFIGETYTGGARNKILSSLITDSDKVDNLIKKFNSEIQRLKVLIDDIETQTKQISDEIILQETEIENIKGLLNTIELEKEDIETEKRVLSTLIEANDLIIYYKKLSEFQKHVESASKFGDKIKAQIETIDKIQRELDYLSKIKLVDVSNIEIDEEYTIIIDDLMKEFISYSENFEELEKFYYQISDNAEKLRQKKAQGQSLEPEIAGCRVEIETFFSGKAICPITNEEYCKSCKQTLRDKCVKGEE